jgi:hypothetical protein
MKVRQQSAGEYKPVSEGAHIAALQGIIDLGKQPGGEFSGNTIPDAYKVAFVFQFPGEVNDRDEPKVITSIYTSSMHKKGKLRPVAEALAGKPFPSDKDANAFDLQLLLARGCFANVAHKISNGKTFANISTVMPLPAGVPKPQLAGKTLYYSADLPADERAAVFKTLPEWLQEKIMRQVGDGDTRAEAASDAAASEREIPY